SWMNQNVSARQVSPITPRPCIYGILRAATFLTSTTPNLNDKAWHHVALTAGRGIGGVRLWVDGTVVGTFTAPSGSVSNSGPLLIGQDAINGPVIPFNGDIDEVELFNRELSQPEVASIYSQLETGKCKPAPGQPVRGEYYKVNIGLETTAERDPDF